MNYELTIYGYSGIDIADVRWFSKKMGADRSCSIESDPSAWTLMKQRALENHTISQKQVGTYILE